MAILNSIIKRCCNEEKKPTASAWGAYSIPWPTIAPKLSKNVPQKLVRTSSLRTLNLAGDVLHTSRVKRLDTIMTMTREIQIPA